MAYTNGIWLDDIFKQETPSGLVNGSNTDFTLSAQPHSDDGVMVFINGIIQFLGVDFVLNGVDPKIIELTNAPALGQSVYVWYVKGRA